MLKVAIHIVGRTGGWSAIPPAPWPGRDEIIAMTHGEEEDERMNARLASSARGWIVLALGLSLVGCGKDAPPEPPTIQLELGTGQQFTPVADGDALRLQRGCQGSQHVFVSLRAWGLPSEPVFVELSLTRTEDEQRVSRPYRVRYLFAQGSEPNAPDELPGLLLAVPTADEAVGKAVRLSAMVETDSGQRGTDSRTGTVEWGPDACP
jgi:hypothetical protein